MEVWGEVERLIEGFEIEKPIQEDITYANIYELEDSLGQMEARCEAALKQMKDQNYQQELREEGFRSIWNYAVCFWKKEAMVKMEKWPDEEF